MASLDALAEVIVGAGEPVAGWIGGNLDRCAKALEEKGALLLRGFAAESPNTAEQALATMGFPLLDNAFWSTPRSSVGGKTFTATEYANTREISLHSEMSYATTWPRLVAFHAIVAAEEGGQTTLANIDHVSKAIPDIVAEFDRLGVSYQRTHHNGVDIPWRKAYQTDDRATVEAISKANGAVAKWHDGDVLQTIHMAQGSIRDESGEPLFFNQSNLFHPGALPAGAEEQLARLFGRDKMPRNATYGDDSPIPTETIRRINAAFNENACGVDWRPGDVLVVDNMRHAHGRRPFRGARKLHVALAQAHSDRQRKPLNWG